MIIGADPGGSLLEVGVVTHEDEGIDVIVHAWCEPLEGRIIRISPSCD